MNDTLAPEILDAATEVGFTSASQLEQPQHVCSINVNVYSVDAEGNTSDDTARVQVKGTSYTNALDKALGILLLKLGASIKSPRA